MLENDHDEVCLETLYVLRECIQVLFRVCNIFYLYVLIFILDDYFPARNIEKFIR